HILTASSSHFSALQSANARVKSQRFNGSLAFGGTILAPNPWIPRTKSQESALTILIVEDEALIRALLTEILEDEGYRVVSVANGLAALSYLGQYAHPHLILLDLGMPVMTGWEFCVEQQ